MTMLALTPTLPCLPMHGCLHCRVEGNTDKARFRSVLLQMKNSS